MREEPYVRDIARTMARSNYPLAWFENYPTNIFDLIRKYRDEISHEEYATGHERMAVSLPTTAVAHTE
jgi:hypothetical protein